MLGAFSGCSGRSIQADNPVLSATPPRMRGSSEPLPATPTGRATLDGAGVEQASFAAQSDASGIAVEEGLGEVAATVNGIPILVRDVLEQYTPNLKQAQEQMPESEFAKLRRELIERELPNHIEQAVLVHSALTQLSPEQREMVDEQLASFFSEYVQQIQAQMGASSLAEMEGILQEAGTSLTHLQRGFNNQSLAKQSMEMLMEEAPEPLVNRTELLEEYERRVEEFTEPEQTRWQQVWIPYKKHGGKTQALAIVDQAVGELKQGASFDDVARRYSDGVKASEGGRWDWTQRGDLANAKIDKMLFDLKVGEIGEVVSGETAFHIVRVTERKPETTKSFADVQEQIGQEIKQRKQQETVETIVAGLKDQAIVTTMFDDDTAAPSATPAVR